MGLLAPLATAGISALSYQHELKKQFTYIEDAIDRIKAVTFQLDLSNAAKELELQQNLDSLSADLSSWLDRAKATNSLFDYIADAENTKLRHRFRAISVIKDITAQTSFLARGIEIDYSQLDDQPIPSLRHRLLNGAQSFKMFLPTLSMRCLIRLTDCYISVLTLMKNLVKF